MNNIHFSQQNDHREYILYMCVRTFHHCIYMQPQAFLHCNCVLYHPHILYVYCTYHMHTLYRTHMVVIMVQFLYHMRMVYAIDTTMYTRMVYATPSCMLRTLHVTFHRI